MAADIGWAEIRALAALLRAVARSDIMPRFRHLAPGDVRSKSSPQDLVTIADEAAEAAIARGAAHLFPGCLVVGEEAATASPQLIAALSGAPLAVVIDPIDGTANFAAGLPLFGVMAAVVARGRTQGAVILDPVTDSWSAALRGGGAVMVDADGDPVPLRVAPPVPVSRMTGMVSWRFMPPALRDRVLPRLPCLAQSWDHRCAAHEYRNLCAGNAHMLVFNRLMPWDHLPGVLLHAEAGGHAAKFDGTPYLPGDTGGGLICAPDAASWRALHAALIGKTA